MSCINVLADFLFYFEYQLIVSFLSVPLFFRSFMVCLVGTSRNCSIFYWRILWGAFWACLIGLERNKVNWQKWPLHQKQEKRCFHTAFLELKFLSRSNLFTFYKHEINYNSIYIQINYLQTLAINSNIHLFKHCSFVSEISLLFLWQNYCK